jgi:multidrug resistance efflux pump
MERDLPLGQQHAISQQIVDEAVQANNARVADVAAAEANIAAAQANVTANRANVARLLQMQSFEQIVAPFDGIISARNVERAISSARVAPLLASRFSISRRAERFGFGSTCPSPKRLTSRTAKRPPSM